MTPDLEGSLVKKLEIFPVLKARIASTSLKPAGRVTTTLESSAYEYASRSCSVTKMGTCGRITYWRTKGKTDGTHIDLETCYES